MKESDIYYWTSPLLGLLTVVLYTVITDQLNPEIMINNTPDKAISIGVFIADFMVKMDIFISYLFLLLMHKSIYWKRWITIPIVLIFIYYWFMALTMSFGDIDAYRFYLFLFIPMLLLIMPIVWLVPKRMERYSVPTKIIEEKKKSLFSATYWFSLIYKYGGKVICSLAWMKMLYLYLEFQFQAEKVSSCFGFMYYLMAVLSFVAMIWVWIRLDNKSNRKWYIVYCICLLVAMFVLQYHLEPYRTYTRPDEPHTFFGWYFGD